MPETTITQELIKMVPVIVGALLATLGGLSAQLVMHFLNGKRDEFKRRRELIERFVKSLFDHMNWLDDRIRLMTFQNEDHNDHTPLQESRMLQRLYFPEFKQELNDIQDVNIKLLQAIFDARVLHMESKEKFLQQYDSAAFHAIYQEYIAKVYGLVAKCRTQIEDSDISNIV